ncbi:putative thiazole-containing bacteriocin maturation protein [Brevibacillus ruminantium]|uniref:Thiazole-containing bacteriocin maturation protein n=1 Tax=Brevibacillus ruminantium TaxID=2950604 RepID=A0ABY4WBY8_9BACL|nr:putative thiazole-containing bacteriocin maturation protein [Brevibacillus ruminantium]USG63280.1 putative thiazole-containing bacteriocin maturation protein [Brevibacillus ruminantium]
MTSMDPSMRLKVKRDTFFLPDPNGSVYFRNHVGSFRMEGTMIDQWIEKLLPLFNGEHTLAELTDGLPDEYRDQVYDIAETLHHNGFVRDVSQDHPHQLPDKILSKFASQIEFLNEMSDSGAYRFQNYRQTGVLAVGSGPLFVSLVSAMLESGLSKLHLLITDAMPTNRQRLEELAAHARMADPEIMMEEVVLPKEGVRTWREAVKPFDFILYVSQTGEIEELRELHAVCREEGKALLPAIIWEQTGLAGPLVHPESEGCWESAWRRVHKTALEKDPQLHAYSSTAGAMLTNVIVFELFKTVTEATPSELKNKIFLLDLETVDGTWHSFLPHPLVNEAPSLAWIEDVDDYIKRESGGEEQSEIIDYFTTLTSSETGIFHVWEEGDWKQLPLAQCRIQVVNPLSEGPAELLPEMICAGLTHGEARKEAGLAGVEAYVTQFIRSFSFVPLTSPNQAGGDRFVEPQEFVGIGAGETGAESVCRGLQSYLTEELRKQLQERPPAVSTLQLCTVEDKRCQYYLQALTTMLGEPVIGLGTDVCGFPVIWVGTLGSWYGSIGLQVTLALRNALQAALHEAQNQAEFPPRLAWKVSAVQLVEQEPQDLVIPACEETALPEVLEQARQVLKQNRRQLSLLDLALEPFLQEDLAGVVGVVVREEESP